MQLAPAARALARSPEYFIPPSAITGMPYFLACVAQSSMAEICGTPTPATIRVVQIEPGPMPTFIPSAPACARSLTAAGFAMLPTTTSTFKFALTHFRVSMMPFECPCAESITMTSTSASVRARALSKCPTPMAAAALRRPSLSLLAFGYSLRFFRSFVVMGDPPSARLYR